MKNLKLEQYVVDARAKGIADAQIQQELLKGGWNANEINEAFSISNIVRPKRKHWILIIVGIIILIIVGLSFVGKLSNPSVEQYQGKVSITEVQGFDKDLDGRNMVVDGKGAWFVWGGGHSWNDSFYILNNTTASLLKIEKDFYPPNPTFFGKSTDLSSHPDSPAAYASRLRTLGTPQFASDKLSDDYLVYTANDPSYSLVYRIADGIARPLFDAPNVNLGFQSDGAGNFYAFIVDALTGGTSIYRINGTSLSEIKNLQNGY